MSHFYGTLQGSRGQATRCGSKNSGLQVNAASYAGNINVQLFHDAETGKDYFVITQTPWCGTGIRERIAEGVLGEAVNVPKSALIEAALEAKQVFDYVNRVDCAP